MKLSVGYITARKHPQVNWFLDSLQRQRKEGDEIEVILIDRHFDGDICFSYNGVDVEQSEPKPTPWSGKHCILKQHWWSKSNSINTAICYANHDWFAAVDDRSVLGPLWLDAIRAAQAGSYVVAGSYEKRHNMKVENGGIVEHGKLDGQDGRQLRRDAPADCPANAFFGCTWAAPLEWLLNINGADERLDGTSMEDLIMGYHFTNAGYPIKYDARMFITEDRTPEELGEPMKRSSRQRYNYDQEDRAWTALKTIAKEKRANPTFDLRKIRENFRKTGEWPPVNPDQLDWWDGKPIKSWDEVV